MSCHRVLVLLSGKRKSGKDHCSRLLEERLGKEWATAVVGVSHSLKEEYSRDHGLDYSSLLSSGDYKEQYRRAMIVWGEEKRNEDPSYFVKQALSSARDARVVIVSDCRRVSDLESLLDQSSITVRVRASPSTRSSRGWTFTEGIDDAPSECALDHYEQWHEEVDNDGDDETLKEAMERIVQRVRERMNAIDNTGGV